jgi:flagellin-like protein
VWEAIETQVRRRGISDVITSLILILTTVSLATVFFFWAQGYLGQSQSATAAGINQNNNRVQEQFSVNQVRFWASTDSSPSTLVSTGDMVTVYIRNFGDIPVTIDHLYFNGVLYQSCTSTYPGGTNCFSNQFAPNCVPTTVPLSPTITPLSNYNSGGALTVSARGVGCINICISGCYSNGIVAWNVGDTDSIEAASTRGNQVTQSFTVPTQDFG